MAAGGCWAPRFVWAVGKGAVEEGGGATHGEWGPLMRRAIIMDVGVEGDDDSG